MRSLVAIVLLLLAMPAHAAETWTYASSEHFEVYTTAGAGTASNALNYFERVHDFLTKKTSLNPKSKVPTRLIIFSNSRQFAPYRPNANAAAFYQSGVDRDYIVMERFDEESTPIVLHEYFHLLARYSRAKFDVWLNEGLAEFYSTAVPENGRMAVGRVPIDRLLYLRSGVTMLELSRLFAINHASPEYNTKTHAGLFYSQSWALTHMLLIDERYQIGAQRFLNETANGMSSAEALMRVYGKTPEAVGRDLANYVSRNQYTYYPTDYKVTSASTKFDTRPADSFEGSLVTANLLGNSADEGAARAAFEKLERQKPDDGLLLESRGFFELYRGHTAAAIPYFARAVEHGSSNAKLLVTFARIEPSRAPELVPKAVALAPDELDVRIENARMLMRNRKNEEALRVLPLRDIRTLERQQAFDVGQIAANAYMQLDMVDDARFAAAIVKTFAEGPQVEFAARLSKSIEDYAARKGASSGVAAGNSADSARRPLPADVAQPQEELLTISGRIRNMVCQNGGDVLEVLADGQTVRLLIELGRQINIVSQQPGFRFNPACGPMDMAVTVTYKPGVDAARKTTGSLRRLDF
jgi:hypothetical protein